SAQFPATDPLRSILARTSVDMRASARAMDIGVWLPAAGLSAPVLGRVDADLRARGSLPTLSLTSTASLHEGIVAGIPIDRMKVDLTANNGRGRIVAAD